MINRKPYDTDPAIDFQKLKCISLTRSHAVVIHLLRNGSQRGCYWVSINPLRPDKTPGSFKVNLTTGQWADFATGDKGGDLISLIAYLDGISQLAAAKKLTKILGATL